MTKKLGLSALLRVLTLGVGLGAVACSARSGEAPSSPSAPPASMGQPTGDADFGGDFEAEASEPGFGAGAEGAPAPMSPPPSPEATADASPVQKQKTEDDAEDRPGLATQWGELRDSKITTVPFRRADQSSPFATVSLFYNDEKGAAAMANASGFRRVSDGTVRGPGGVVTVGLKDGSGRFLSGFKASDRNYVVGEAGDRYSIVIQSNAPRRVEVLVSVDGLDVLNGRAASFKSRGYLIDANGRLEIEGFRTSTEQVAAFRFGSVKNSYANKKHGETRNVGVIGVALFHEEGTNPFPWTQEEVDRRHNADPFPGQFATPPGQ